MVLKMSLFQVSLPKLQDFYVSGFMFIYVLFLLKYCQYLTGKVCSLYTKVK